MCLHRLTPILACFLAVSVPALAAVTQADLQGHWSGSLTDAAGTTVYALDFAVDSTGAVSGTGDGRPFVESTLSVKDGSVTGTLHWFYVDTGVYFKWDTGIPALQAAGGQLNIHGPVAGSAYVAPMPAHDTGTWTLDITGGNGATAPQPPSGNISFTVTRGKEIKSCFSTKLQVSSFSKARMPSLTALTLAINSAVFPVHIGMSKAEPPFVEAKLAKGTLLLQAHGLNLIELFGIDLNSGNQTIATPLSITGVDAGGNAISFMNGTVTFNVTTKNGVAKGSRVAGEDTNR
ncbi:MAG TPA: hypothetical protein VKX17_19210 [Planctomycetota bacterium]|nr:hypothetical protein [Planctomycetota bacterium]